MSDNHLVFILFLFIIALFVRDDFIFTIVYLLAGVFVVGRIWNGRALRGLRQERKFTHKAFCGEEVPVQLTVSNRGWLPVVWLRLIESVPTEIAPIIPLRQVLSLGPRSQVRFDYVLRARKRGYYPVGPLFASSGDLFGLTGEQRWESSQDVLIVYPRIIRLSSLKLPASSPQGTLRHAQPVYEDPTRIFGKREYISGDSLRRVDWKATAASGRLQVKLFDPSISLITHIVLGLNINEYDAHHRVDATELAIVVAASMAEWVIRNKQNAGLTTNGLDPLNRQEMWATIAPRKGQAQLIRMLELLARVQAGETQPLVEVVQQEARQLPWGTTVILICGQAEESLFEEMFRLRRYGLKAVVVLVGRVSAIVSIKARCQQFNIPLYHLRNEFDLDIWRQ